jgi:hypothetical protein
MDKARSERLALTQSIWTLLLAMGAPDRRSCPRRRRRIQDLLRLADGTTFAPEADTARTIAARLMREGGDG